MEEQMLRALEKIMAECSYHIDSYSFKQGYLAGQQDSLKYNMAMINKLEVKCNDILDATLNLYEGDGVKQ